ncbi:helix-turn-helix domain-containing protein [Noviherbaspirillum autotrophicum]|uniref:HTH cro/C1-type domain-containing protein n=1 Tax=Noviherbaspirillum autotrophicum TaxID=709839 RepID=A0A0C2BSK9_9BURK|nr:helix-turn-helix domain-containing protein [Noviherbaspirillum autotrophicum]KIF83049.1 hypothetical protein TSA66_22975 [Noviherbaspirillum autotrophicum]
MALPGFHEVISDSAGELRRRIADRVRVERRRLELSQKEFADRCGIPLRTFKRFEQGQCDSLEVFLNIVVRFERVVALELLFPPKPAVVVQRRTLITALERMKQRR